MTHRPHDDAARHRKDPQAGEEPAIPDGVEQRLGDDPADAGEDVAHEVVDRHAGGGFLGHELRQHGRRHAEDEHAADAEEEVGDELRGAVSARVRCGRWGRDLLVRSRRFPFLRSTRTRSVRRGT